MQIGGNGWKSMCANQVLFKYFKTVKNHRLRNLHELVINHSQFFDSITQNKTAPLQKHDLYEYISLTALL